MMNWYKLSQMNEKKPYKALLLEGGILREIRTLENVSVYAVNEKQAFVAFCKDFSWFEGYARDKRREGKRLGNDDGVKIVLDRKAIQEDREEIERAKKINEQQLEMRWDLKY
jgi:hypothetical protein